MKKILLITSLVCGTAFAQESYNKLSVDLGYGISKAHRYTGLARKVNPVNFDIGARYMFNNNLGAKFNLGYTKFKNKKDVLPAKEFNSNYLNLNLSIIGNVGHIFGIESVSEKLGLFAHAGGGLAFLWSGMDKYDGAGADRLGHFSLGSTFQFKATEKIAIYADMTSMLNIRGQRRYDFTRYSQKSGLDQAHLVWSIGANIYIGKEEKHADWVPNNYEPDMTELNALKARVAKAENDMKDDDSDGVPNYLDEEPGTESGAVVDTKGRTVVVEKIVDADGDGILDIEDFCPTMPGVKGANGCPDADGDGIYDFNDKCPKTPGAKDNEGCPVITKATVDAFKKAEGVQFENGKATILKKSFPQLDNVVKIMKENPSYKLEINGHTDNVGDPGKNVSLSKDRAASVKAYLLGKGIDPSRIESNGYGDTQPKASNATAKGRAINRRVEFIIKFKE